MRAFLDDQPLTVARPTFAAALAAAVAGAQARGRIVVEASSGGARVPDATLEAPPDETTEDDIRFVSVEPAALVRSTLLDAADALDQARTSQMACARLIQSGEVEQSLEPLGRAIETWRAVRDALEKSLDLLGTAGRGGPGAEPIAGMVQSLWSRLEEVRRSLSAQDWSALADALSYDMNDQAEQWKVTLRDLAGTLARESA